MIFIVLNDTSLQNITVIAKNGDWWTGTIGDRTGVFPFNYVEPAAAAAAPAPAPEVRLPCLVDTAQCYFQHFVFRILNSRKLDVHF